MDGCGRCIDGALRPPLCSPARCWRPRAASTTPRPAPAPDELLQRVPETEFTDVTRTIVRDGRVVAEIQAGRSKATSVAAGSSTAGTITPGDVDIFAITLSQSGRLSAYTTGGTDTIGVILVSFRVGDTPSEDDHGNSRQRATKVTSGSSTSRHRTPDDVDYFAIRITQPGTLWSTFRTGAANLATALQIPGHNGSAQPCRYLKERAREVAPNLPGAVRDSRALAFYPDKIAVHRRPRTGKHHDRSSCAARTRRLILAQRRRLKTSRPPPVPPSSLSHAHWASTRAEGVSCRAAGGMSTLARGALVKPLLHEATWETPGPVSVFPCFGRQALVSRPARELANGRQSRWPYRAHHGCRRSSSRTSAQRRQK